jgi:hypothetical protein
MGLVHHYFPISSANFIAAIITLALIRPIAKNTVLRSDCTRIGAITAYPSHIQNQVSRDRDIDFSLQEVEEGG